MYSALISRSASIHGNYAMQSALCDELTGLLEKATIECDDALKVIKRYDTPGAFFFLDPPYVDTDMGHYKGVFTGQDLMVLLEMCKTLRGKFMLTAYPDKRIRCAAECSGWEIHKVERRLPASKTRRRQEEWIVCNYTL